MATEYISHFSPKIHPRRISSFSHLKTIAKTPLIHGPTPTYPLQFLGKEWGHGQIYIKREDLTASHYGGNKIRNLEYLFGDFEQKNYRNITTPSPIGSNFTAALASAAHKEGIDVITEPFMPHLNKHLLVQRKFSEFHGVDFKQISRGPVYLSALRAYLNSKKYSLQNNSYFIHPGGSNLIGALGHVNAAREFAQQVLSFEVPSPDLLVVGAGTCGTLAGLIVGFKLAGMKTRIVGIRCVDKMICHRFKVLLLANRILSYLGEKTKISLADITIIDPPGERTSYANKHSQAHDISQLFLQAEGIHLDTTYTSKVALALHQIAINKENRSRKILYWHTYSHLAHEWYSTQKLK